MTRLRELLQWLAIILIIIPRTGCNLEPTFTRCCVLGTKWASDGLRCSQFPAPVERIASEEQSLCLSAVDICCIKTHREMQCRDGKSAAKDGRACLVVSKLGGEHHKDCCEACKLGILSGSTSQGCKFSTAMFGHPWDPAYEACCLEASPSTVTSSPGIPTPALDSLCDLLPGELCGHICVSVPDSYHCECRPGFTLMSDGKTCQEKDRVDRCQTNNPCAHKCVDNGVTVECSCRPGFKLGADKRSCNGPQTIGNNDVEAARKCPVGYEFNFQSQVCDDIDECLVNRTVCGINFECQNTIASYTCVKIAKEECPDGYRLHDGHHNCQDINECAEALDSCNRDRENCLNTDGSYECQDKVKKSQCPAGYKYNTALSKCEDVNECLEQLHGCTPHSEVCRNTEGAYECDTQCAVGFTYSDDQETCVDVDECSGSQDKCPRQQQCVNTKGSFRCMSRPTCPAGYKPGPDRRNACQDVDECREAIDSCDHSVEYCVNEVGSFRCDSKPNVIQCAPGYAYDRERNSCVDVDECSSGRESPCNASEDCINTHGSHYCTTNTMPVHDDCPAGFRYNSRQLRCFDINECEERIYVCNLESESCINEPGGYRCGKVTDKPQQVKCQTGYVLHPLLKSCIDVDECTAGGDSACDSSQNCKNTPGSYLCTCKVGFELDRVTQACADVNECQVNQHDCLPSQRCDNTIGSFQCIRFTSCGTGYTLNSQSGLCEDDDECVLGTDTCRFQGPIWQCRNTLGSFRCERKRCEGSQRLNSAGECHGPGLTTTYTTRTSLAPTTTTTVVTCAPGFELNRQNQCIDINECERSKPCRRNQRCYNIPGAHRCINLLNCNGGFKLNEEGTQCIDVDECATNTHDCSPSQLCQNLPGGYICQCPAGYAPNNVKECIDVDECTRYAGHVCAITSVCQNTPGSYRCVCKEGFRQGADTKSCEDVDECKVTAGLCHQTCINMWGSYRCVCEPGFRLNTDNRSCSDFDECDHFKEKNLCVGLCVNQPGSYSCQCPQGYRLGSDGRTCQDNDECQSGNACRSQNEICLNTRGSYRCNTINCPPNFVQDTEHKNRCKRASPYCREGDQACLKLPMTYSFNFITFVSNLGISPSGHLDLFTMRGPHHTTTRANFNLEMLNVHAPTGVPFISKNHFRLRNTAFNQAVISLVKSIPGPQEIELQLSMDLHQNGVYGGSAVAKLFIYVSQYEY